MPQYVKHSGVWREVKEPYVRHLGSWRSVKEGYVRHAGIWRRFHSSGLTPGDPSSAGQPFGGGFYAGANIIVDRQEYALVVAPRSQGGLSDTTLQVKTERTETLYAGSLYNGLANTNRMANHFYPAAQFCRGLNINGHTDWYLPSRNELEICYRYLKPTTDNNNINGNAGVNPNSNPVGTAYTSSNPAQTSNSIFQQGGGEDFHIDSTQRYWSSSIVVSTSNDLASHQSFNDGYQANNPVTRLCWVRAVRRVAV